MMLFSYFQSFDQRIVKIIKVITKIIFFFTTKSIIFRIYFAIYKLVSLN